ncbi:TSUP family transporter [Thiohalophilus sp.]|uniref:TSUP family transporter n=1 Tax=Thiohalophilus sp. TaxID=3028392 RepID=UPI003A10084B
MDSLIYTFPVSGVQTALWLPPLVAFVISFFTSMVGISGAFLLLPFQMSVLHYTAPSVSATNMVFNLVAIPGGVYRYLREGRVLWSLTAAIALGTLPGIAIGYVVRVRYLPDPVAFKLFVGGVLLYIAYRVFADLMSWRRVRAGVSNGSPARSAGPAMAMKTLAVSPARVCFRYQDQSFSFSVPAMVLLAFVVGIIGGIYGIGGGAIIAPFCITLFGLPVYTVAGAALAATLLTSVFGVLFYSVLPAPAGLSTQPDWALGVLFGLGGLAGMYLGARAQKYIPQSALKLMLGVFMLLIAGRYIAAFFVS